MANQLIRKYKQEANVVEPILSISLLADYRARALLSKDAFKLYRAMRCGLVSETNYKVDLILYEVTHKEWVEALTLAMEAGHG